MLISFATKALNVYSDYLAPDGLKIRTLPDVRGGGLAHCTITPHSMSSAAMRKTADEIWYFIEGQGEVA